MENNIYFTQLASHLYGLNDDEREDVVSFYREYAADASLSGEALIREFGTPKQLARRVLIDYSIRYDDVAQQSEPDPDVSPRKRNAKRVKRELNLLWIVVIGLLMSWMWLPAIFIILLGLFLIIVLVVVMMVVLLAIFAGGVFAIITGIAVINQDWSVGLFQIGFGIVMLGAQLIAWPIGLTILRVAMSGLMNFVKFIGRRFSHRQMTEGGHENA